MLRLRGFVRGYLDFSTLYASLQSADCRVLQVACDSAETPLEARLAPPHMAELRQGSGRWAHGLEHPRVAGSPRGRPGAAKEDMDAARASTGDATIRLACEILRCIRTTMNEDERVNSLCTESRRVLPSTILARQRNDVPQPLPGQLC